MSTIQDFTNEICLGTGISFSVFQKDGKFVAGNYKTENFSCDFEDIFVDIIKNKTLFNFKFKNKEYIGVVKGASKTEKNYALLIRQISSTVKEEETILTKSEFLKHLLLGEINYSESEKYIKKFTLLQKPAFVVLMVYPKGKKSDVETVLLNCIDENCDALVNISETETAFIKYNPREEEFDSPIEFGEFLVNSVFEELGIKVDAFLGGTVKGPSDLAISFEQASLAVKTRMFFNSKERVHSYREYMLVKILEGYPKQKLNEYLDLLIDEKGKVIFKDQEMVLTAEEFLENSLNVSETSRRMYIHRNTLNYRLDKIERETGLNIRRFSDALIFRLILILFKFMA